MPKDKMPSVETRFVGAAMANFVIGRLATNLAIYLASPPPRISGRPIETGAEAVTSLLGDLDASQLDPAFAGLPDGSYDADIAKKIALEMIHDQVIEIRSVVFGEPRK